MNNESYIRGFCKAAEEYGVDPELLVKVSESSKLKNLWNKYVETMGGFGKGLANSIHPLYDLRPIGNLLLKNMTLDGLLKNKPLCKALEKVYGFKFDNNIK